MKTYEYYVVASASGKNKKAESLGKSETYTLKAGAKPYISIPLNTPQAILQMTAASAISTVTVSLK